MSSAFYGEDAGDCWRLQERFGRVQLCVVKMCDARHYGMIRAEIFVVDLN
tara:strand:+ start:1538 stop:1687 length:150 start_codon:yes stop_codon:yes gene_type:complete